MEVSSKMSSIKIVSIKNVLLFDFSLNHFAVILILEQCLT